MSRTVNEATSWTEEIDANMIMENFSFLMNVIQLLKVQDGSPAYAFFWDEET